ncbi:unnamed protein product [Oppiella nova]|uniref:Uncharacterized protein n=1 Tax=Oppiella nova TaxID=334625 RepID=A0A7R9LFC9_9ACAR|nr:unnamed protein product [Oppiella nova]CAG2163084.1 unnamed protein product [Oppiella nova]
MIKLSPVFNSTLDNQNIV